MEVVCRTQHSTPIAVANARVTARADELAVVERGIARLAPSDDPRAYGRLNRAWLIARQRVRLEAARRAALVGAGS